jgi:hypothetical protein
MKFVYWDGIPGRRLRPDLVNSAVAERVASVTQAGIDAVKMKIPDGK